MNIHSTIKEQLTAFEKLAKEGKINNLSCFLPYLKIDAQPMTLKKHFQLAPLYNLEYPKRFILKTARQVGKSYGIASQGTLQSNFIPRFKTLYIQPRFDQIKYFSNIVMKPFIQKSFLRDQFIDSSCEDSVLMRTFKNESRVHYSYCFRDADRVRGLSGIDKLGIDECLSDCYITTYNNKTNKNILISNIKKGMHLYSFDTQGRLLLSTAAKDVSARGTRHCWEVTTETGQTVIVTEGHSFPTDTGRKHLSEVIKDEYNRNFKHVDRTATADVIGDSPGRREPKSIRKNKNKDRCFSKQSRVVSARVQFNEVSPVIRARYGSTVQKEEQRLRRMVERLENEGTYGTSLFVHPDLSKRQEGCDHGVAEHDNTQRPRLVGVRRRVSLQRKKHNHKHPRLLGEGSTHAGCVAPKSVSRGIVRYNSQQKRRQTLPCALSNRKRYKKNDRPYTSLRTGLYEAQDSVAPQDMSRLRAGDNRTGSRLHTGMLRTASRRVPAGLLRTEQRTHSPENSGVESEQQRPRERTEQISLLEGSGTKQRAFKEESRCLSGETQRRHQQKETNKKKRKERRHCLRSHAHSRACALLRKTEKRPRETEEEAMQSEQKTKHQKSPGGYFGKRLHNTVETTQPGQSGRTESKSKKEQTGKNERPRLQGPCECGQKSEKRAEKSRINKITYAGVRPVYDIEVVGTHNYVLANGLLSYNCQDIDAEFIPVLAETMSASEDYGIFQFTGTPKTTDNTLNVYWEDSSMAEWVIPCKNCKKLNVPAVSQDLLRMIGKTTMVCANPKCAKPLDARDGWYEHARPAVRHKFSGLHIPQVIHPIHYTSKSKWYELHLKMKTYSKARFWNEILGEACDEASKLLTPKDIADASSKTRINDFAQALALKGQYETLILGVDWTGGGMLGNSSTVAAICGIKPGTDRVDVLYTERFHINMTVPAEVGRILHLANAFGVSYIAHDYTGAGNLREVLMVQAGFPERQIIGFSLHTSNNKEVVTYNRPTAGQRESWTLDKPRSLLILANMIKGRKVELPELESSYDVTSDFLALQEEVRDIPKGGVSYMISKAPNRTDDCAFAVDFGCSAIWHIRGEYPTVADTERFKLTQSVIDITDPAEVNWEIDGKNI